MPHFSVDRSPVVGKRLRGTLSAVAMVLAMVCGRPAEATLLSLNSAGTSAGLGLTTFATGFSAPPGIGPLGIAVVPGTAVFVDTYEGNFYKFTSDTDNQTVPTPLATSVGTTTGLAFVNGALWIGLQNSGTVREIAGSSGVLYGTSASFSGVLNGLVADPAASTDLIVSAGSLNDFNTSTSVNRVIATSSGGFGDVTASSTTVYAVEGGTSSIVGFSLSGTNQSTPTFTSAALPSGPSGVAFWNGNLWAVAGSSLYEISTTTGVATVYATGASVLNWLQVDPSNNTLFIDEQGTIQRLTSGLPVPVPEPGSLMFLIGGVAILRKRLRG